MSEKDPAAVSLGKRGGKARADKLRANGKLAKTMAKVSRGRMRMSRRRRSEISRAAAHARWARKAISQPNETPKND